MDTAPKGVPAPAGAALRSYDGDAGNALFGDGSSLFVTNLTSQKPQSALHVVRIDLQTGSQISLFEAPNASFRTFPRMECCSTTLPGDRRRTPPCRKSEWKGSDSQCSFRAGKKSVSCFPLTAGKLSSGMWPPTAAMDHVNAVGGGGGAAIGANQCLSVGIDMGQSARIVFAGPTGAAIVHTGGRRRAATVGLEVPARFAVSREATESRSAARNRLANSSSTRTCCRRSGAVVDKSRACAAPGSVGRGASAETDGTWRTSVR